MADPSTPNCRSDGGVVPEQQREHLVPVQQLRLDGDHLDRDRLGSLAVSTTSESRAFRAIWAARSAAMTGGGFPPATPPTTPRPV